MKKTLGALGLVAFGAIGLTSFVSGQQQSTSELIVNCSSAEFTVEVSDLHFGTITSTLNSISDQAGTWTGGATEDGIYIVDTYAGCNGTGGTSWDISMSLSNLVGTTGNATLSLNTAADSLVDTNGDGDVRIAVNQAAGVASVSAALTLIDGVESPNVQAQAFSEEVLLTDTPITILDKATADTANGIYRIQPTVDMDIPGGLIADVYQGTVDITYPSVP